MSFTCPIHGHYAPVPGTTTAICPSCQSAMPAPMRPPATVSLSHPTTGRGATITVEQLQNGYWRAAVAVRIPGAFEQQHSNDRFHDAGEALDWARFTVETAVGAHG